MNRLKRFWPCLFGVIFLLSIHANVCANEVKHNQEINREKLLMLLSGEWVSRALYVVTKLEVADYLGTKNKSVEELAQLTQSDPDSLYRALHLLAGFNVFKETSPRVFANSGLSDLLIKSHPDSLHSLSLFYGEDIHKSWDKLLDSVKVGRPAFELAFKQPVFSYFRENRSRGRLFQQAMKEKSMAVIKSVLSSYDFSQFQSVCDVGGGTGKFIQALLKKYPNLYGIIFELPEVVKNIGGLENPHCHLVSGDFFESLPKGKDVYLLKSILHDWDDDKCQKILQNCRVAMNSNSRLLIIDVVLQPRDLSLYANCMDLLMMAITGGKERNLDAFNEMFENSGFVLEKVHPTSTEFSILEIRKK